MWFCRISLSILYLIMWLGGECFYQISICFEVVVSMCGVLECYGLLCCCVCRCEVFLLC